jgi:RNA polymerase sigma-70 factor (ECF subfamily)
MAEAPFNFPLTRWTLLQVLRDGNEAESKVALETLCKAYWMPLYFVARRRGMNEHDAEDVVQGFFLWLLRREMLEEADQARGRLRAFLLTSFENFICKDWQRQNTLKRGGGVEHVHFIPTSHAEEHYLQCATMEADLETLYNREWARNLLQRSLESLGQSYQNSGRGERFESLMPYLTQAMPEMSVNEAAAAAGMSSMAFRTALSRVRVQFRERIEGELALTLGSDDPDLIRQEMQDLFKAFESP